MFATLLHCLIKLNVHFNTAEKINSDLPVVFGCVKSCSTLNATCLDYEANVDPEHRIITRLYDLCCAGGDSCTPGI